MNISTEEKLPNELKSTVVEFCSRGALASLSLVNKDFQHLAEKELYASLILRTRCEHSGPLRALSAGGDKASYVKHLNIEFSRGASGAEEEAIMKLFLSSATLMRNLKDLHIRLRENLQHHFEKLNGMLCGGHFQLNSLIVAECLDLEQIIEKHDHLKVLGIYVTSQMGPPPLISSLNKRPLMTVGLGDPRPRWFGVRYTRGPFYQHLIFLPELLTLDQARTLGDLFHHYFKIDTRVAITLDPEEIVILSIHVREPPSQEVFRAFMESVTRLFPQLLWINFYLKPGLLKKWKPIPVEGEQLERVQVFEWEDEGIESLVADPVFTGSKQEFEGWVRIR